MAHLIAMTLQWLAHKLGLLLLIIGVLLVGSWLKGEWEQLRAIRAQIETQEGVLAGLRSDLAAVEAQLAADTADWSRRMEAAAGPLRTELDSVGARIAAAGPHWQETLRRFADLERQAREARRAADGARAEVAARQEALRFWDPYLNPERLAALEAAKAKQALLDANAKAWESARDRVAPTVRNSPLRPLYARQSRLAEDIAGLTGSVSPRHAQLVTAKEDRERRIEDLEALLAAQRERVAQDPREKFFAAVRSRLPLALGILLGVLLLPVAIKAFLYFVLAPLAGRLPPIRILPGDDAPAVPPLPASAVSAAIDLAPGEELLVQPEFLQSSGQPAHKQTQWFLNAALPFASLASGMFALTRIRPAGDAPTRVVVSSQQDAFGEVGVLDLPAGAALVLQPRALAGVVKPAGAPLRITRHWRLPSLHAWLTLQLRYLVFHGPCRLVLKGCRGVKSEEPQPGHPRLINQSATLGFSANLEYRTTRCETFVAYLRGKEDLFNDLFAGGHGRFVYEEMPAGGRRGGVTGRGLEGLADAALKAFGI
jgi:uncharacterized protein (AIM24 family)